MNPSNSSVDSGRQAGTAPVNVIDNPKFVNHQGLNQFDLSQQVLFTARYGEVTPFFNMECVGRDRVRLRNSFDLRSYTLKSPLLSSLRMKKSYFQVPLSAILPNTWQYLFTNPLKGNDIPDNAQCRFNLNIFLESLSVTPGDSGSMSSSIQLEYYLKSCVVLSCLFSAGGLLFQLGFKNNFGVDKWLEENLFSDSTLNLFKDKVTLVSPYDYLTIKVTDKPSLRTLFYSLMEYPDSEIQSHVNVPYVGDLISSLHQFLTKIPVLPTSVNISKVVAYQFLYSQFFTNDKIDNVYNSELFLSNQKALAKEVINSVNTNRQWYYLLNGTSVEYDVYSGYFMDMLITAAADSAATVTFNKFLDFWINTFSIRRSLRYGDYFTGARTQPLAVGNTVVNVANSGVSVVDINKSIHIQRFLNACNRVGSNLINYTKGIFGYEPPKDYHQPSFIASETEFIGGQEVENTSDSNQGNVVTNLRSSSSKFEFDVFIDNPCYIIGVITFECTPAYANTINRDFFHFNRFEYFNPMLQNIGDQPISMREFNSSGLDDLVFGYQSRYAEYKHRYSECNGGFVFNLPSWAFIKSDDARSISEFLIRSRPDEFDRFYSSLTYCSPAGYYHFIISIVNNVDALRPMEVTPSLL